VVGNVNRDLTTAPLRAGPHLLEDGETAVAAIRESVGGGGANSACTAAALGARVVFLGKVGADPLGARLEALLRRQGIDARLVRDATVATGTSLGLNYDSGQRHFVSALPNNAALRVEELDLAVLAGCGHLLRADVWFSEPMLFGGNARLFAAARAAGVTISLDLNWDPQWGVAAAAVIEQRQAAVRAVLPMVALAHGNARELCAFTGAPDLRAALGRLEAWGVAAVVVHLGAEGAGYYSQGQLIVAGPAPVERVLHTTGCGDVLSVCMMLLQQSGQLSIPERLRLANGIVAEFMAGRRQFIPALEG
jgi:sugar/nucleoside kinase (ribokinase family)